MKIHKEPREHGQELHLRDVRNGYQCAVEDYFAAQLILISDLRNVELEVILVKAHECKEVEEHVINCEVEDNVHG